MLALVPRKSNRCASSLAAWFSALSTSWRSTLLTTSKDESAIASSALGTRRRGPGAAVSRSCTLFRYHRTAGCPSGQRERTVNPSAQPTKVRILHPPRLGTTAPDLPWSGAVAVRRMAVSGTVSGDRGRACAGDGGALQRPAAEEQPAEGDVGVAGAAHGHLGPVGLDRPRVEVGVAAGQLAGHGGLRRGPGERQLRADPGG